MVFGSIVVVGGFVTVNMDHYWREQAAKRKRCGTPDRDDDGDDASTFETHDNVPLVGSQI